jgi:hypothetical protein
MIALPTGVAAMYYRREFAYAGGQASYGACVIDANRQAGVYVSRVARSEPYR